MLCDGSGSFGTWLYYAGQLGAFLLPFEFPQLLTFTCLPQSSLLIIFPCITIPFSQNVFILFDLRNSERLSINFTNRGSLPPLFSLLTKGS